MAGGQSYRMHACGSGGFYASHGIFDDHALAGYRLQFLRRQQK
jgi:hypothetical protein